MRCEFTDVFSCKKYDLRWIIIFQIRLFVAKLLENAVERINTADITSKFHMNPW